MVVQFVPSSQVLPPLLPSTSCLSLTLQLASFQQKKKDLPGQGPLLKRADDELKKIIELHNDGKEVIGAKAKVLAKILAHEPFGFKVVSEEIASRAGLLELQLQGLSELMISDVSWS